MPPTNPIHFMRQLVGGVLQEAGNRVQLEDATGTSYSSSNPIPVSTVAQWTPTLRPDENLNDSDKTFVVGASTEEQILNIRVEFTSTATVGDRQLVVEIQDDIGDVIAEFRAGAVQAASLTRTYNFAPGVADLFAFRDTDFLTTPIPASLILPAGYQIRVYDQNAVDAAADDMIVQLLVARRSV